MYELDYQLNTKELRFGRRVHAEILHEGETQIFRTWIMKDGEQEGQAHILYLSNKYNPKEYVENFIKEIEEEEAKIK